MFNGRLKITVFKAKGLQLTSLMAYTHGPSALIDPYVVIDVDNISIDRTSNRFETCDPEWNESFKTEILRDVEELNFTVFNSTTSSFIANCKISLSDCLTRNKDGFWVNFTNAFKNT